MIRKYLPLDRSIIAVCRPFLNSLTYNYLCHLGTILAYLDSHMPSLIWKYNQNVKFANFPTRKGSNLEFLGEAKGDFPGGALRIRGLILERLGSGGGAKLLPRRPPLPLEE